MVFVRELYETAPHFTTDPSDKKRSGGQLGQIVNNFKSVREALSGGMSHLSEQILPLRRL